MSYKITIWYDNGRRVERTLLGDEGVIGRTPQCDVSLDDPAVSRRHARLVRTETGLLIGDLGSTNGTYVNGRRVQGLTNALDAAIRIGGCRISIAPGAAVNAGDSAQGSEIDAVLASVQQLPDVFAETELPNASTRASGKAILGETAPSQRPAAT